MRQVRYLLWGLGVFILLSCARNPEHFYFGNYSQAERLYQKGEYERAIQKYQEYIDENPEGNLAVISLYYIARSHMALGHDEEARALFDEVSTKHPDLVWAHFSEMQLKEMDAQA
ncbi:MAG: tetratricopeptide repeat protein [Candidatus Omnitrophica bacterium]|nr:tetratricopeptide repeat protein [Candidatus Omnitrophota bacterium]